MNICCLDIELHPDLFVQHFQVTIHGIDVRCEGEKDVVSLVTSKPLALKLVHKLGCAIMQLQFAILISAIDIRIANSCYDQVFI